MKRGGWEFAGVEVKGIFLLSWGLKTDEIISVYWREGIWIITRREGCVQGLEQTVNTNAFFGVIFHQLFHGLKFNLINTAVLRLGSKIYLD